MDTYSLEKGLPDGQKELLRFEYELAANKKEYKKMSYEVSYGALGKGDKYMPDTKFKKCHHAYSFCGQLPENRVRTDFLRPDGQVL